MSRQLEPLGVTLAAPLLCGAETVNPPSSAQFDDGKTFKVKLSPDVREIWIHSQFSYGR